MLIRFFSHNNLQANVCASVYFPRRKKEWNCHSVTNCHIRADTIKKRSPPEMRFFSCSSWSILHSPIALDFGLSLWEKKSVAGLVYVCIFCEWLKERLWVRESSTGAVVGKVNRHFFQRIYIASAFHPYTTTTTTIVVMESIGRSLLEKMCRHFPVWIGNVERKRLEVWEFWVAAADSPSPPPLERPNRPKWVFSCFREGSKTGEEEKRGREKV